MVHRVSARKFSRDTNHRKALLKNLANELILHERIVTTEAKAKTIRPFVEKLITRAKVNSLNSRRKLISVLSASPSVDKLLDLIGPLFKERKGGYTRIIKIAPRAGDSARMAVIEFVENVSEEAAKKRLAKSQKKEIKVEKPKVKKETKPQKAKAEKQKAKTSSKIKNKGTK